MIPVTYIQRNAKSLTTCFNQASSPLMVVLYAKLTIIEIGGWTEMSMDDLIERASKKLKEPKNIKQKKEIIKKNYGFDYEINFRGMLIKIIGLVQVEKLESKLDAGKHAKMKAALELLKSARNTVAHTYIKNPTTGITISSPSVTTSYFIDIYEGLKDIEAKMKILRLL